MRYFMMQRNRGGNCLFSACARIFVGMLEARKRQRVIVMLTFFRAVLS